MPVPEDADAGTLVAWVVPFAFAAAPASGSFSCQRWLLCWARELFARAEASVSCVQVNGMARVFAEEAVPLVKRMFARAEPSNIWAARSAKCMVSSTVSRSSPKMERVRVEEPRMLSTRRASCASPSVELSRRTSGMSSRARAGSTCKPMRRPSRSNSSTRASFSVFVSVCLRVTSVKPP